MSVRLERRHQQLAHDCWQLIKVLITTDVGIDLDQALIERDDAARNLIEMACDSAVESERIARGFPPAGSGRAT